MRISDWSSDVCSSDLIQGRAGERAVERSLVGRVVAIACQLKRQRGRYGSAAHVVDVMLYADVVAAFVQGIGFYNLDTIALRFEDYLQRIAGHGCVGGH